MNTMSYDEAIERIGFGRFQRRLMVMYGLGWAAVHPLFWRQP